MTTAQRIELFAPELSFMKNHAIRGFAEHCLSLAPDYFFEVPASLSGEYHPRYALGHGGLVRHTRAAMRIFHDLVRAGIDTYYLYSQDCGDVMAREDFQTIFEDEIYAALLLHDTWKNGLQMSADQSHSVFEHPLIAADFVRNQAAAVGYDFKSAERIASAIESHMGKWCVSRYSPVVLPPPQSGSWQAQLVHLCDYLASRKTLEYNFSTMDVVD